MSKERNESALGKLLGSLAEHIAERGVGTSKERRVLHLYVAAHRYLAGKKGEGAWVTPEEIHDAMKEIQGDEFTPRWMHVHKAVANWHARLRELCETDFSDSIRLVVEEQGGKGRGNKKCYRLMVSQIREGNTSYLSKYMAKLQAQYNCLRGMLIPLIKYERLVYGVLFVFVALLFLGLMLLIIVVDTDVVLTSWRLAQACLLMTGIGIVGTYYFAMSGYLGLRKGISPI